MTILKVIKQDKYRVVLVRHDNTFGFLVPKGSTSTMMGYATLSEAQRNAIAYISILEIGGLYGTN